MTLIDRIRSWAHALKRDTLALWIAARSPDTPFIAKLVAAAVAAYAFSPIDLIPDFIPVIGLLDDIILIPLGIELALRLIPHELMERFRAEAEARENEPRSLVAGAIIVAVWLAFLLWLSWELLKYH
ncbi:DUF1232 domain-containing protein [Sphingomonas lacunae]|uniref:DUF1232 domain-containing protein n=1 Tax=Sphingomonas lacunae TaxID=2698828 RepID=A0A6M4AU02_9SPHN|nr:DUF1232 domain-containing protein [Sphingomonas lacunae]QJQ32216.1 DUF1232 domain-containing protein [Sphingomonas lacunae]